MSDTPGLWLVLGAIGTAVSGLCLSLFVRPRRIWVRLRDGTDGARLLEVGGLDRADARTGLDTDVADLTDQLTTSNLDRKTTS